MKISFAEAVSRASRPDPAIREQLGRSLLDIQRADARRFPAFRAEGNANDSRSTDVFAETPFRSQYLSATLAFDYPLLGRDLVRSQRQAAVAEAAYLRRMVVATRDTYAKVLHAYADVYAAQQQRVLLAEASESLRDTERETGRMLEQGQISLVTAASSREALLWVRSQTLDIDLVSLAAQSRLREAVGEEREVEIEADLSAEIKLQNAVTLDREALIARAIENDAALSETEIELLKARLSLLEAQSRTHITSGLSGFGGIAAARSDFSGRSSSAAGFGIYGLRVTIAYPLFDRLKAIDVAEGRLAVERAESRRDLARASARENANRDWLQYQDTGRRIALLEQWVATEREREGSIQRLIQAGVRREADLGTVVAERIRREGELLEARIDRWRLLRLLEFERSPL